jgi:Uncharacterized conserved protein
MNNLLLTSATGPILKSYNLKLNKFFKSVPRPSVISGGQYGLVVTSANPDTLQTISFGYASSNSSKKMNLINVVSDQFFDVENAYIEAISQFRCVVLVDGFFATSRENKNYLVRLKNSEQPFAIAGIYSTWLNKETNREETGFAILTTSANSAFRRAGIDQMPVILSVSDTPAWLDSKQDLGTIFSLIKPFASEFMSGHLVSKKLAPKKVSVVDSSPVEARLRQEKIHSSTNRIDFNCLFY